PERRECRDDVLRTVRQHDPDPVALRDPKPGKRGGQRVGSVLDMLKGELRAEERGGSPIRKIDRRGVEDFGERPPWVRQVRLHPVVVMLKPWACGVRRGGIHAIDRPPSTTMT